jgi:hypothetical protein
MQCQYCCLSVEDGIELSIDHIIPRSKGGDNDPKNLVTACKPCNTLRGNTTIFKFTDSEGRQRIKRCIRRSINKYRRMALRMMKQRNATTAYQVYSQLQGE